MHAAADVPVPAERLWQVLVDWPRHAEWVPFTRAEGGGGTGERIEAWTGIGRLGFLDVMDITAWNPPYRVAVRHVGAALRGEGRFDVLDLPGGRCRVTWAELIDLPFGPAGRAGWIAVGPLVTAMLRLSLRRLAKLFE